MNLHTLEKLASFTSDPQGGNPAGVWIGEMLPKPKEMQQIAAEFQTFADNPQFVILRDITAPA